jgi:hypothetical protein
MIEIVENILPISGAEWDVVASERQKYYPDHDRTGDHLRTKFNALAYALMFPRVIRICLITLEKQNVPVV